MKNSLKNSLLLILALATAACQGRIEPIKVSNPKKNDNQTVLMVAGAIIMLTGIYLWSGDNSRKPYDNPSNKKSWDRAYEIEKDYLIKRKENISGRIDSKEKVIEDVNKAMCANQRVIAKARRLHMMGAHIEQIDRSFEDHENNLYFELSSNEYYQLKSIAIYKLNSSSTDDIDNPLCVDNNIKGHGHIPVTDITSVKCLSASGSVYNLEISFRGKKKPVSIIVT